MEVFKNLKLAYLAMDKGGNTPCVLNAANEVTNKLFREGKINFLEIADLNEAAMANVPYNPQPGLKALFESDQLARDWVKEQIRK
jgi:1-deoxy-D-xylulose-5-phosphate reductoisomerase